MKPKCSIIRVIDIENGPEPDGDEPGIIEYGHIDLVARQYELLGNPFDWDLRPSHQGYRTFVKPHAPIPPETSAIHNIINEDVAFAPSWSEVIPFLGQRDDSSEIIVAVAAHNIKHEKKFIGPDITGDIPWICSYKVALRLWPDFASHSNGAVRYALNPSGLRRELALPVHRALPDAYVTAFTVREALNLGYSVETLVTWSSEPALLPKCKIGKWRGDLGKGTPWPEVDSGFLQWLLEKDFDEDTKHTAHFHLYQREIDQREERELAELNRQSRANGLPESVGFGDRRPGIHGGGKPANDFIETNTRDREHPRDTKTLELDL